MYYKGLSSCNRLLDHHLLSLLPVSAYALSSTQDMGNSCLSMTDFPEWSCPVNGHIRMSFDGQYGSSLLHDVLPGRVAFERSLDVSCDVMWATYHGQLAIYNPRNSVAHTVGIERTVSCNQTALSSLDARTPNYCCLGDATGTQQAGR
jgi:hypothetical protein